MSEATHDPPHKTSPDAQTHDPFVQVVPVPHIVPHAPQFWLSVAVSKHSVPHAVWPALHEGPAGVPPSPAGPNPGPAAPVAQLTTTKSAQQKRNDAQACSDSFELGDEPSRARNAK
jgi:hypothetical protein